MSTRRVLRNLAIMTQNNPKERGPYMTRVHGLHVKGDEVKPLSALLNRRGVSYKFEFIGTDRYGLRVRTSDHCCATTIVNAYKANQ